MDAANAGDWESAGGQSGRRSLWLKQSPACTCGAFAVVKCWSNPRSISLILASWRAAAVAAAISAASPATSTVTASATAVAPSASTASPFTTVFAALAFLALGKFAAFFFGAAGVHRLGIGLAKLFHGSFAG